MSIKKIIDGIEEAAGVESKIRLQIGNSENKSLGFSVLDKRYSDVVSTEYNHDIQRLPYPLKNNTCELILINQCIGHIKPWNIINLINECWRLLINNGVLLIITPYGNNDKFTQEPENVLTWNQNTYLFFCPKAAPNDKGEIIDSPFFNDKLKPWEVVKNLFNPHWDVTLEMRKINGA